MKKMSKHLRGNEGVRMQFPPILKNCRRGPQVMLPKDIGMIIAFTGIGKKSKVVDAGAGSGFLAITLGNISKSVVSYEWREDFAGLAEENVKRAGLKNVTIKRKNVFDGIDEKEVDLVTLDMAGSDIVVGHAKKALKQGGYVVGYLPHMEQVKSFVNACGKEGLESISTIECIMREFLVREEGMRPQTTGILHTGYLVFARNPIPLSLEKKKC
jgi:tRNA (adenine57-N1/adenine58-N1)-methyltransferase